MAYAIERIKKYVPLKKQHPRVVTKASFVAFFANAYAGARANVLFALPKLIDKVEQFLRRMDIQFVVDVGNMGFRGMNRDNEFLRNILRIASLGNKGEDFALSLRQLIHLADFCKDILIVGRLFFVPS